MKLKLTIMKPTPTLLAALLAPLAALCAADGVANGAAPPEILAPDEMALVRELATATLETCGVAPGAIADGKTSTLGFRAITPGGYPAIWIQDFTMNFSSGLIAREDGLQHFQLILEKQNGPEPRDLGRQVVIPAHAIPDHINVDGAPVFFPGTYDPLANQNGDWGFRPPSNNQFDVIWLAHMLARSGDAKALLSREVGGRTVYERLKLAFAVPEIDPATQLVRTTAARRAVGFIFYDAVEMTGDLLMASLIRYRAALHLAWLATKMDQPEDAKHYAEVAQQIRSHILPVFADTDGTHGGWLKASNGISGQSDVWGSIYAIYIGAVEGEARAGLLRTIAAALAKPGEIEFEGALRHVPLSGDASPTTMWEKTRCPKNRYENGAYWHIPVGWLLTILQPGHPELAQTVKRHWLGHLRAQQGKVWECIGWDGQANKNPSYGTSIALPLGVLSRGELRADRLLSTLPAFTSHAAKLEPGSTVVDTDKVALYVSPQGSDSNPGTVNQPFQTAKAARDAVRACKSERGLPPGGMTVFFRAGVYEFSESFSLDERDSGTVNSRISYRAFPGEQVIFSGGKILDQAQFKPVTDSVIRERLPAATAGRVVQYDLKQAGLDHYGDYHTQVPHGVKETPYEPALELYIGGKAMPVARYPNEGWIKIGKVLDPGAISKEDGFAKVLDTSNRGGTFEFDIPEARRWTKANDMWLSGWFFWGWFYDEVRVASLDVEKKQFQLASALRYGLASAYNDLFKGAEMAKVFEEARKYYVFNLLEEIDQPGEWYLDRATGILYVLPTETFSREQIMVTALNAPIVNSEKAAYVSFEELEFVGGRKEGFVAKNADGVRLAGCLFRNLGGNAITLAGLKHEVVSCDIYQTKGGIIASGGSRRSLTPSGIVIRNCDIHHFNGRAIDLNGVGITVEHNEIHHAEGGAVGFSGNNHLIAYNSFNHLYNGGGDDLNIVGIGRNPSYQGSLIKYNLFSEIGLEPNNVNSVYLDDGSCGTTVYGNIFYRASTGDRGSIYSNGGSDNTIINNVFVDNPVAYWLGNCFHNWAKKRIVDYLSPNGDFTVHLTKEVNIKDPIWVKTYPKLANYFEDDPATPKRNAFSRNVVINSKQVVRGDKKETNVQQVNERLEKDNFIAAAMPDLIDWREKKLNTESLSQVLKALPEFEAIPFAKFGTYKDGYRK